MNVKTLRIKQERADTAALDLRINREIAELSSNGHVIKVFT